MCCENDENLPIFVYGTLRHGQRNYRLLDGRTCCERPGYTEGLHLFSLGDYPMVRLAESSEGNYVYGELMTPTPETYYDVLADLDQLEEYDPLKPEESFYLRVLRDITLTESNQTLKAWMYIGTERLMNTWYEYIPDGDWCAYHATRLTSPVWGDG